MNKITASLLVISIALGISPSIYSQEITVGTMDVIKNLNPYLAQKEIELALQKVVFPPLIADFIVGRTDQGDSFRGILIDDGDIWKKTGTIYLEFSLKDSSVSPDAFITNFNRVKSLGPKCDYSWNLNNVEELINQRVKVEFKKEYPLSKLIAASFPLVNFDSIDGEWDRSDQVFITHSDRHLLMGFSDYCYKQIDPRRSIVRLAPKTNRSGRELVVKSFPDYNQLIQRLYANEIQVAFNISALTQLHNPGVALDDMKFANQYVLFMEVTNKGRAKGLADMDIINHIRRRYNESFPDDRVLHSSGTIFLRNGFLLETTPIPYSNNILNTSGAVTLLYQRNTINDRIREMVEQIITKDLKASFRAVAIDRNISRDKIDENDFDLVIKSRYVQFPEFLNLRFYKEYLEKNSALQLQGYKKRIERLLSTGGKLSILQEDGQNLEKSLLRNLPIVFFLRYNTRIAIRQGTRDYQSKEGVPYFFYRLENW